MSTRQTRTFMPQHKWKSWMRKSNATKMQQARRLRPSGNYLLLLSLLQWRQSVVTPGLQQYLPTATAWRLLSLQTDVYRVCCVALLFTQHCRSGSRELILRVHLSLLHPGNIQVPHAFQGGITHQKTTFTEFNMICWCSSGLKAFT